MLINALNSGAKVFMADFEDATSPDLGRAGHGQVNLRDYWLSRLSHTDPETLKHYKVGDNPAVADGPPARLASPEDQ
jgi:malate synthase